MATICNVRIFDGTAFRKESAVTFENGTVTALDDRREGEDMGGVLLCPGFVDIHMHGQKGLDSMAPGGQRAHGGDPGEVWSHLLLPRLHHRDGRGHPGLSG